jgi:hypothetical protein
MMGRGLCSLAMVILFQIKQETIQKSNEKPKVPTQGQNYSKVTLTYQDLSNDTNYVKIGRWEPGVLGRHRGGDKVKNIHL